ncbi:hypothetical protein B0H14DRAFT_3458455 [Mycena olivaceomarginata]|nr:hypothetical protein B0H14DRAFT_3458455 [Mycena olivaceomarginata]
MTLSRMVITVLFFLSHCFWQSLDLLPGKRRMSWLVVGPLCLAVAPRLSEDSVNTVIVLEAGSDGFDNPNIANLSGLSIQALTGSSVDWNYKSQSSEICVEPDHHHDPGQTVNGALSLVQHKIDLDLWESAFGAAWVELGHHLCFDQIEHFLETDGLTSTLSFHGTVGPICDSQRTPTGNVWGQGVIPAVLAFNGSRVSTRTGGDPSGNLVHPQGDVPEFDSVLPANSSAQC